MQEYSNEYFFWNIYMNIQFLNIHFLKKIFTNITNIHDIFTIFMRVRSPDVTCGAYYCARLFAAVRFCCKLAIASFLTLFLAKFKTEMRICKRPSDSRDCSTVAPRSFQVIPSQHFRMTFTMT